MFFLLDPDSSGEPADEDRGRQTAGIAPSGRRSGRHSPAQPFRCRRPTFNLARHRRQERVTGANGIDRFDLRRRRAPILSDLRVDEQRANRALGNQNPPLRDPGKGPRGRQQSGRARQSAAHPLFQLVHVGFDQKRPRFYAHVKSRTVAVQQGADSRPLDQTHELRIGRRPQTPRQAPRQQETPARAGLPSPFQAGPALADESTTGQPGGFRGNDLTSWPMVSTTCRHSVRVNLGPSGLNRNWRPATVVTMMLARVACPKEMTRAGSFSVARQRIISRPVASPKGRMSTDWPPKCRTQRATFTPLPPAQRRSLMTLFFSSHTTSGTRHSTSTDGFKATTITGGHDPGNDAFIHLDHNSSNDACRRHAVERPCRRGHWRHGTTRSR